MSLRWRLALGLGLITLLVVSFVGVGAYLAVADRLENSVDDSLTARAAEVTRAGQHTANRVDSDDESGGPQYEPNENFTRPTMCPPAGAMQPAAAAQLVSTDGSATVCIEGGVAIPVDKDDRDIAGDSSYGSEHRLRTVSIDGRRYRVITVAQANGSALQIARGLGEVDDVLASLRRWLLGIGAVGVGAAVVLGWFLARRTVRPVVRLQGTAEQIAATQDLAVEVPVGGPLEIASLGRSFTTMVDALSTSRKEQQQLVSDASHELRTPLTSLRTNAELLGRSEELTPEQRQRVVEGIEMEVDELTNLVSELVELATDRTDANEPIESVALDLLANEVAERAERRSGRVVTVTVDDAAIVPVRPQMITRAISNLVDNALKYSSAPEPIEIVVQGTRVEVLDRGPGIPAEDQAQVFDRFYRSPTSRTEPGSGLGLAIVKQAVVRHGGTVWATNRTSADGKTIGASVGFELPNS